MPSNSVSISDNAKTKLKQFLYDMYINKEVWIWWVINYWSTSSNVIKFTTQSMFSHVNFWDPTRLRWLGAEDLQRILLVDYKKYETETPMYYVTKKLDFKYLAKTFNFNCIEKVFFALKKISEDDMSKSIFRLRYSQYLTLKDKYDLNWIFEYLWKNKFSYNKVKTKYKNLDKLPMKFIDEFIVLWIVKHIYRNFWKKYDLWSTLSICFTPWIKTWLEDEQYFCSEFVSENLLFSWIYPFDVKTKDPKSVAPWDILDLSHIYSDKDTTLYYISKTDVQKLDFGEEATIWMLKDYIFSIEELRWNMVHQKASAYFIRDVIIKYSDIIQKNKFKKAKIAWSTYLLLLILTSMLSSWIPSVVGDVFSANLSWQDYASSLFEFIILFMKYFAYSFILLIMTLLIYMFYSYRIYLKKLS